MNKAHSFFIKQISIRSALLAGVGVLTVCCLILAVIWNPLLRELGYTNTPQSIPENTHIGVNALNPAPRESAPSAADFNINRDIDLTQLYNSIQVGKDKDHLMQTVSVGPSNCSTFQVATLGAEEICTWINGDKAVLFTMLNDKILAKSKYNF